MQQLMELYENTSCNQGHSDYNHHRQVFLGKPAWLNVRVTTATYIEQYTGLNCILGDNDDNLAP